MVSMATWGLDKLSITERIELMHELYESIEPKDSCFELTELEKQELDQDVEECRRYPEQGVTWKEACTFLDDRQAK